MESVSKTFRRKTVANSDDIYISNDNRNIMIHNVSSSKQKDKKGNVVGWITSEKVRKYPNTSANRKKAESLVGKLRKR